MKKRVLPVLLSMAMVMSGLAGCGGSSSKPAETKAETEAASTEAAETEAAETQAAETQAAETETAGAQEGETAAAATDALSEHVATFMASHGRPVGDLIVDLEAPEPEELTEEQGAELDRAMRAYTPGIDSLLVNHAKSFYYYEQLDADQQVVYDTLLMLCEDPTDTNNVAVLELPGPADDVFYSETLSPAYYALMYDHPELFWLYSRENNYIGTGDLTQDGKTLLYIGFTEPYVNYEQDMKAFNQAAEDFLKDIDTSGSEAEIADAIHDKLIDMVVYDDEVAQNNIANDLAHSAYGALVANSRGDANTCVCDGYSLAYVYLCQQAGLEAAFLCGMAGDNEQSAGGHAWSIVKIDGQWNEVDACWDDWDDLFEELEAECQAYGGENAEKIMMALSDNDFQNNLKHYLDCVSTEYITAFDDIEPFVYFYDDGSALVLINESVHIRMNEVPESGPDGILMAMAPVAQ